MDLPQYEKSLIDNGIKTKRWHYTKEGICPYCGEVYKTDTLLDFTCEKCGKELTYYLDLKCLEGT